MPSSIRLAGLPLLLLATGLLMTAVAQAEVVFSGSGATLSGDMAIDAAQGVQRGGNLFHSFRVFNVLGGERAQFDGPGGIRNVIARVTGGTSEITGLKSSLIDGPLVLAIPGASFYFINPNGVVFAENGFIDATGSVFVSTADSLRLADGGVFHADATKASVLTTADPVAFGFLSASPAPIMLQGPWMGAPYTPAPVPAGSTLALIGGAIDIVAGGFGNAAIVAPGASVLLASVAAAGEVLLTAGGVDVGALEALGRISMEGGSFIDVGASELDGASGSIVIRAGDLHLVPAGLLAQTFGDADGGRIDIALRGDLLAATDPETGIVSAILAGSYGGLGKGASVSLSLGGSLRIGDGSFLISESYGPGAAGDIHIRAGAIEIRGQGPDTFTGISADNYDLAAGPRLTLATGTLSLLNGGFVGTRNFGPGSGGALTIDAQHVLAAGAIDPATGVGGITLSLSSETTDGPAGDLTVRTATLQLRDGARISSSTGGPGRAGDLDIAASASIDIDGSLSGIFSATAAGANGNAGNLRVAAPLLTLQGGVIDSTTVGDGHAGAVRVEVGDLRLHAGAQIRSFSGGFDESNEGALVVGSGNAGSVSVQASGLVELAGSAMGRPSALLAETRGAGAGGNVGVQASVLRIADGALVSSSSLGEGLAGQIDIRLSDSLQMQGGSIATRAQSSDGGNIAIVAPRLIHLAHSQITTSVESGVGAGGNIAIDPQFVLLQNSQIVANAFGGPGGNISIVAGQLIADPSTIISASSALGIDGSVNIDAPDTDVSAGLALLTAAYLDAASLMRAGCSAARAGLSSLVEVGRGGLPPDPDAYLSSIGQAAPWPGAASVPGAAGSVHAAAGALLLAALGRPDCAP